MKSVCGPISYLLLFFVLFLCQSFCIFKWIVMNFTIRYHQLNHSILFIFIIIIFTYRNALHFDEIFLRKYPCRYTPWLTNFFFVFKFRKTHARTEFAKKFWIIKSIRYQNEFDNNIREEKRTKTRSSAAVVDHWIKI